MCNRVYICLGANDVDAEKQLNKAFNYLKKFGSVLGSTPVYPTDPEYAGDVAPYMNRIVLMAIDADYSSFVAKTKEYERRIRAKASPGRVAVDIDVVEWNGEVMRPADAAARYYKKGLPLLTPA